MAEKTMHKAHLDSAQTHVHGKITKQVVKIDSVVVTKWTYDQGAKWSEHMKEYAGTESCLVPCVGYVLSGAIAVRSDSGEEESFAAGDVMMLPPGYDAWNPGSEPCSYVEFSKGDDYYKDVTPPWTHFPWQYE
jgi:quercetin dioxygenase-like cupin family protein